MVTYMYMYMQRTIFTHTCSCTALEDDGVYMSTDTIHQIPAEFYA